MASYLEDYCTQILDGKIIACNKMKKQSENLLDHMRVPNKYHFDESIALRHIEFIERFCKQPSGKLGKPIKLELFQRARLEAIFGFVDDNDIRQYNECITIEGRKNGKTTETAAVEIDVLCNDGEGAPQIYNIATMKDQANLGYMAAVKMVRQSPQLSRHIRKRTSDLYFAPNMGFIKAMASNTNGLDGLDTHLGVIDELAAIKNRDLYDLIKQSMSAREQPLLFCITTNGFVRDGIFDAQYEYASGVIDGTIIDEHFLAFIYELDSYEEWTNPKMWIKANPGLGTIKSIDYLTQCVEKAKVDDTFKPTVLVKDFNLKQNNAAAWLTWEELSNDEMIPEELKLKYAIGGFDAADSIDLTAAKLIGMRADDNKIYCKSMYWVPESKMAQMKDRHHPDDAPYDIWEARGLLTVVPGNKVSKQVILDWYMRMRDEEDIWPLYIGYDPWHIDDSLLEKFKYEFGKNAMIPVRQGVATLSQPMKDLKADFQAHNIVYNANPIDRWCFANTYVKSDINGNIQPQKGQSATKRIDGAAALLDAYVVLQDKKEEYLSLI